MKRVNAAALRLPILVAIVQCHILDTVHNVLTAQNLCTRATVQLRNNIAAHQFHVVVPLCHLTVYVTCFFSVFAKIVLKYFQFCFLLQLKY